MSFRYSMSLVSICVIGATVTQTIRNRTLRTQDTSAPVPSCPEDTSVQKTLRHWTVWPQDTSAPRHFGTSEWTFRHQCVDTSALAMQACALAQACIGKRPLRTLKVIAITYGFRVTQGHRQCHHSIECIRFLILHFNRNYPSIL